MTNTDIATMDRPTKTVSVLPYEYMNIGDRWRYATALAGAKELLPKGLRSGTTEETAAKVFLILETGAMLGLHPMGAFQGIDVIEGKATISPRLFTALARSAGHKLREQESGSIREGTYTFTVTIIRKDDPEYPVSRSFGLEDAVQAGLCQLVGQPGQHKVQARSKNGDPLPWERYTKDLVQWRAYGRLMRAGAADVTMGVGYFPEELDVLVTEEGEVIRDDGQIEERLIETIKAMDDKADLARIWGQHHPKGEDGKAHADDFWSPRVEAEFAAHLSTVTKDSRPAKPQGAPGNTGDARIDEPAGDGPGEEDAVEVTDEDEDVLPDDATEEEIAAWEAREVARARARGELI
jgi:hypothetical protein